MIIIYVLIAIVLMLQVAVVINEILRFKANLKTLEDVFCCVFGFLVFNSVATLMYHMAKLYELC